MAIEEKILLQIEQANAAQTIKELRTAVNGLRESVNGAKIGSEDYRVASEGLTAAQNALANATKLGTKETKLAGDSYNALSRTMAELKQQYHSVTDEVKRQELASEIKAINDRLKAMDSEVGVFTRNVGNYASALEKGFSGAGGAAAGLIGPINGVKAGFTALSTNPIITILGFAINLFNKVTQAMKSSEEGSQALAKAFDGFKVIADLLTKGLQ
jgi:chromosome segregation ATPase